MLSWSKIILWNESSWKIVCGSYGGIIFQLAVSKLNIWVFDPWLRLFHHGNQLSAESVCFALRWQKLHRSWTSSPLRQPCRSWASVAALQLSYHTRYCEPIISALAHHHPGAWTSWLEQSAFLLCHRYDTEKCVLSPRGVDVTFCPKQYNEQLRK